MKLYRVLISGYDFPPIPWTEERRYIAAGDITSLTDEDAAPLLKAGRIEPYEYTPHPSPQSDALESLRALYGINR